MSYMDKLPTVISCCFCCFLRAGTVMIGLFSFIIGLIFAPNVNHAKGFWDMKVILSNYNEATEANIQFTLGAVSIMLCIVSGLLIIGSCCNLPILIEIYQWGAMLYSISITLMFFVLAVMCFFLQADYLAGAGLCILIIFNVLFTAYFVMVANSLRMSLQYIAATEQFNALQGSVV